MGKATRWIRGLFGMKKGKENVDNNNSNCGEKNEKKRRSFAVKSGKDLSRIPMRSSVANSAEMEQNKHAIAVAAATAAAADAAVAAAQAAAAVVRLTSQGRGAGGRERWAAIKIQSVFRGYLARKALRALKGLVKLQALIRGYLVRKRAAATLYSMQALMRAQSAIRCERARINMNHRTRLQPETRSRKSIEKFERSEFHSRRHSSCYEAFNESPKIVEIDTCGPRSRSRSRRMSITSDYNYDQYHQTIEEFDWGFVKEDYKFATAQNTPRLGCSGGRGNAPPVTPPKSVCGDGRYANGPSYMANTQSSQAKLRSLSAPRQRPEPGPMKRLSLSEIVAARSSFSGGRMQRACPQVHEDFEF